MDSKNTVVIGWLGTQLDSGGGAGRWEKWRPTVALTQHPDRPIARLELLYTPQHLALAQRVSQDITQVSPQTLVTLVPLAINDPWDFEQVYAALYDWLQSYAFDTMHEQYWAHITTGTHVAQICMFLLVEARFIPGLLVQTAPPRKQRAGNPGEIALIDLDLSRYDALAQRFAADRADALTFLKSGIATRNSAFNKLIEEIERVAVRSRAPILLTGPTGAGKSFLARRMFELKKTRHRMSGGFVEVNCATLQGDSAASTLFGHKKGAFTGAAADRAGLLRTADQGVLFLDEIGELKLDEQAMLLKAIEEKRFFPVGSDREVESDFQLIAGTNRDLRHDVASGRFREDLFARINLWSYCLPGLAQRPEDIEPTLDYLLAQTARELQRQVRFNVEARKQYLQFSTSSAALWTGNFRDLAASVTRLATLADGSIESGRISELLVDAEIDRLKWLWVRQPQTLPADDAIDLVLLLGQETYAQIDLFDRAQLECVVRQCRAASSLSEAGRTLFSASRTKRSIVNDADRLRKYLARFGLDWQSVQQV
jgi:transcriptional regulatory protein RtcR